MLSERQLDALARYLLSPSGRLAERKVFTEADVAVAASNTSTQAEATT